MQDVLAVRNLVKAARLRPVPSAASSTSAWMVRCLDGQLGEAVGDTFCSLADWVYALLHGELLDFPASVDERVLLTWIAHLKSHAPTAPDPAWLSAHLAYCGRVVALITDLRRHAGRTTIRS